MAGQPEETGCVLRESRLMLAGNLTVGDLLVEGVGAALSQQQGRLAQLRRNITGVLDGWSLHPSAIRRLREDGAQWLEMGCVPAYASDPNPMEEG